MKSRRMDILHLQSRSFVLVADWLSVFLFTAQLFRQNWNILQLLREQLSVIMFQILGQMAITVRVRPKKSMRKLPSLRLMERFIISSTGGVIGIGDTVQIAYNPENPNDCIFITSNNKLGIFIGFAIGIVFCLIAGCMLIAYCVRYKDWKKQISA